MKRFVNGDEMELSVDGAEVVQLADRLMVRTPEGTYSAVAVTQGDAVLVSYKGRQYRVERQGARARSGGGMGSGDLRSPMPGQIVDIRVEVGASVRKGETLLVLEAMKTQQPIVAPFDGKVTTISVQKGDQVADGITLAIVTPLD